MSGKQIEDARKYIAHSIINAQADTRKRPKTGPTVAHVPTRERDVYAACEKAVKDARAEKASKLDPTKGATNFNFRKNNLRGNFYGIPIKTQIGPLDNSYPTDALPASGIYANTYGE